MGVDEPLRVGATVGGECVGVLIDLRKTARRILPGYCTLEE